jgi:hypothetical protein
VDESLSYLKMINPELTDADVKASKVGRLRYAQPMCPGLGQFPRRRGGGWVRQIALTSFLPGAVVIDFPDDLCAAA